MKEVKVGDLRKDVVGNDNMWEVTAVGKEKLLARVWRDGEVVQSESRYNIGGFKVSYPVILDEDGNPVDPEPAVERRCEIDWKRKYAAYDDGGGEYLLTDVVGRRDFVAFEAENGGSRCLSSPHWMILKDIDGNETISTCSWYDPSGMGIKRVRARWVILGAKP